MHARTRCRTAPAAGRHAGPAPHLMGAALRAPSTREKNDAPGTYALLMLAGMGAWVDTDRLAADDGAEGTEGTD